MPPTKSWGWGERIVVGAAVVIVIFSFIAIAAILHEPRPSSISTRTTLMNSGRTYTINGWNHQEIPFLTSVNGNVTGGFIVDGTVSFYILTNEQFDRFADGDNIHDGGAPQDFVYKAKALTATTTAVSVNVAITAGSYYILIFNSADLFFSPSVTITVSQPIIFVPS